MVRSAAVGHCSVTDCPAYRIPYPSECVLHVICRRCGRLVVKRRFWRLTGIETTDRGGLLECCTYLSRVSPPSASAVPHVYVVLRFTYLQQHYRMLGDACSRSTTIVEHRCVILYCFEGEWWHRKACRTTNQPCLRMPAHCFLLANRADKETPDPGRLSYQLGTSCPESEFPP